MDMGQKIYNLRIQKGLTLEELGNMVGVGKSTVRKWENGMIANMKRDKILKVSEALDTTPAYLMGWEEENADIPEEKLPEILDYYNSLNDLGKHEATKRVEELTYIEKYTKSEPGYLMANAAHADEKIKNPTSEMLQEEEKIMDDDNF